MIRPFGCDVSYWHNSDEPITAGQVYLPMYGTRTADGQTSNTVQIQIK